MVCFVQVLVRSTLLECRIEWTYVDLAHGLIFLPPPPGFGLDTWRSRSLSEFPLVKGQHRIEV